MLVLHAVAFLLFVGRSALADDDPIVEMPLGKVRGYTMTSRSGRKFLAFSSIPYAKPPVGERRFQPPEAVPIWRGIKDATKELPLCIQHNIFAEIVNSTGPLDSGVEDCLYLSVFTHSISGKAPVLFHIYGGGFAMGWGQLYGPEFLMDEDIVIVNINYRVGIFGFLSFESPELPGNQGLKDQVQALRWVQQNIASFGGDPNQVTIIGESAGGASVYHHIISPLSKGLFHKAIAESGTSYTTWALAVPGFARSRAERLAAALDCPKDPKQAVSCLSKKDPFEILSKFSVATDNPTGFGPVMEGSGANSFISQNPSKWTHEPVPLLMGITSAEGLILTLPYLLRDPELKNLSRDFNQLAPALFSYSASASDPATITNKLRKFYFPNKEITLVDWVNLNKLTSDSFMSIPVMEGADKHEGDVYFYYFDYKPKNFPPGVDEKLIVGANHCFEVPFIWSNISDTYYPPLVSEKDVGLSKALVKLVGNFIKNGVPTIDGSKMEWKKWTAENHNYIHLDSNGFHLKKGLIDERYNFWKGLNYKDKMEIPVTM